MQRQQQAVQQLHTDTPDTELATVLCREAIATGPVCTAIESACMHCD